MTETHHIHGKTGLPPHEQTAQAHLNHYPYRTTKEAETASLVVILVFTIFHNDKHRTGIITLTHP